MSAVPADAKIYHITHVKNLAPIVARGGLLSDAQILAEGGPAKTVGMPRIKRRRLEELQVSCHPGTMVGDFVPFYFCPRSVMLFMLHKGNDLDLAYGEGQDPMVHIVADLRATVRWAKASGRRWAFTESNAGAYYAAFHSSTEDFKSLDWGAIASTDFRLPEIKEKKQAEFLLHEMFPLELVERIGVHSARVRTQVLASLATCENAPEVEVRPDWYF